MKKEIEQKNERIPMQETWETPEIKMLDVSKETEANMGGVAYDGSGFANS